MCVCACPRSLHAWHVHLRRVGSELPTDHLKLYKSMPCERGQGNYKRTCDKPGRQLAHARQPQAVVRQDLGQRGSSRDLHKNRLVQSHMQILSGLTMAPPFPHHSCHRKCNHHHLPLLHALQVCTQRLAFVAHGLQRAMQPVHFCSQDLCVCACEWACTRERASSTGRPRGNVRHWSALWQGDAEESSQRWHCRTRYLRWGLVRHWGKAKGLQALSQQHMVLQPLIPRSHYVCMHTLVIPTHAQRATPHTLAPVLLQRTRALQASWHTLCAQVEPCVLQGPACIAAGNTQWRCLKMLMQRLPHGGGDCTPQPRTSAPSAAPAASAEPPLLLPPWQLGLAPACTRCQAVN